MKTLKVAWWFPASPKKIFFFALVTMFILGSFFNTFALLNLDENTELKVIFSLILQLYIVSLALGLIIGVSGGLLLFFANLWLTLEEKLKKLLGAH